MDKIETIEKIGLELEEIRKFATIVNSLKEKFTALQTVNLKSRNRKNIDPNDIVTSLVIRNTEALNGIERSLNKFVNDGWDYLNSENAISDVDIELSKIPMRIINEEKNDEKKSKQK